MDNKIAEEDTKKTITFIIATLKIKYVRINLTKNMKDLYTKDFLRFLFFLSFPLLLPKESGIINF